MRSPTAEALFAAWPGVETDSAGLAPDADTQVSTEQLEWAEIVFVMERAHKAKLTARFGARLKHKKIVCLDIPDRYAYMQPELIALLERKVGPLLRA
ncbi:low molecular weight protein tyrosine phosphatase family protein [Burkholderia ambifaria]|uniref:low molecular weight protein tyrosine phosphatase family protein n=1 Tax=Burkholderia ambifaria TaxID=152480 RepID=UPI001E65B1C2|nr:low molecular weight protein tyrosine phosphatase family protein [Burkholderia ambifaria]UEP49798.1 low molecular weight protein tyrosine phosphatase family protein [Burkholderia ambifaria]